MLITGVGAAGLKAFFYNEGYVRTCSAEYRLDDLANRMVHLTNDAVQKKGDEYGKFESGNKLSFAEFQKYLDSVYGTGKLDIVRNAVPQMKAIARKLTQSVVRLIDPEKREHCFEVFGLDFMIDVDFKVWLIEANTNPCLDVSSPHLARIIPTMLDNALRLALDPLFPPPRWSLAKRAMMPENAFEANRFELIFDEALEELKPVSYTHLTLPTIYSV
eukprot:TRINITY_DN11059_c0_g1_i2.p1 TRINITY_DN11059_c0_g1~~TRINITY_DN11059_c0_g1_i2.p1  ORF type:complete len:217 (-),score=50.22 TRINITY_DN11059_c0_g1_i2:34-684(-)